MKTAYPYWTIYVAGVLGLYAWKVAHDLAHKNRDVAEHVVSFVLILLWPVLALVFAALFIAEG